MKIYFISFISSLALLFSACSSKPSEGDIQKFLDQKLDQLIYVEGGSFMMGDTGGTYKHPDGTEQKLPAWTGSRDNKPPHKVTLDSYYISKYEVTYADYDIFTLDTDRSIRLDKRRSKPQYGPTIPVGVGSWHNAKAYCLWLAEKSQLPFDLPTEAQWEYAARSRGQNVPFATDTGFLDKGRNTHKTYQDFSRSDAVPVGLHPPNSLGLYDMSFNVEEWVNDWYDSRYYSNSPELNPAGPATGEKKVLRGGFTGGGTVTYETILTRYKNSPDHDGQSFNGMRCALNLKDKLSTDELKKKISHNN